MCWSETASFAMVGLGAAATAWTVHKGRRWPVPVALGYFTAMEALQAAGYMVIDDCGSPVNQSLTLLSYLHIVFQPFVINAFAMELIPDSQRRRAAAWVYSACALAAATMLLQVYPFEWAGSCVPDRTMCAANLCLTSGDWHIAWNVPYNGLMNWFTTLPVSVSFPGYVAAAFLVPLAYGAWPAF